MSLHRAAYGLRAILSAILSAHEHGAADGNPTVAEGHRVLSRLVAEDLASVNEAIARLTLCADLGEPDREALGRQVRHVWMEWAREQPTPKPSWLVPWEGLAEPDREVDRRIGEALVSAPRAERDAAVQRANDAEEALRAEECALTEMQIEAENLRREVEVLRGLGCREAKEGEPESGPCGVCLRCAEERGARWALDAVLEHLRCEAAMGGPGSATLLDVSDAINFTNEALEPAAICAARRKDG